MPTPSSRAGLAIDADMFPPAQPDQILDALRHCVHVDPLRWRIERMVADRRSAITAYLNCSADGDNPEFSALRANLKGLSPATVFTADDDPLRRSCLCKPLINAGVSVDFRNLPGVTREFFSMGAVLDEAQQADNQANADLKRAFMTGGTRFRPGAL
jgi:acetyl esterase/lipase